MVARLAAGAGLRLRYANRHGLIAGATGTGKTVTVLKLAEELSAAGVPVFLPDMKGDAAALARSCPAILWDLYGEAGHGVRVAVRDFDPPLFARALGLNDTQAGVLAVAYRVAADRGLPLDTLADLRAALSVTADDRAAVSARYGLVSAASVAAIMRGLVDLDPAPFRAPSLDLADLMRTEDGAGVVSLLAADRLVLQPRLYAAFLLWLLSRLFDTLPEIGDPDRPRLVLIFDEAHLLFQDAPAALVRRIEQVVRLVRSKGVGVYLCTQSPGDVPDAVLRQLGNRVQHALRAFTPRDQKDVKTTAETFRGADASTLAAVSNMGVGEALVSFLGDGGVPDAVRRVRVDLPACDLDPLTAEERKLVIGLSPIEEAAPVDTAPVDTARGVPWRGVVAAAGVVAAVALLLVDGALGVGALAATLWGLART